MKVMNLLRMILNQKKIYPKEEKSKEKKKIFQINKIYTNIQIFKLLKKLLSMKILRNKAKISLINYCLKTNLWNSIKKKRTKISIRLIYKLKKINTIFQFKI